MEKYFMKFFQFIILFKKKENYFKIISYFTGYGFGKSRIGFELLNYLKSKIELFETNLEFKKLIKERTILINIEFNEIDGPLSKEEIKNEISSEQFFGKRLFFKYFFNSSPHLNEYLINEKENKLLDSFLVIEEISKDFKIKNKILENEKILILIHIDEIQIANKNAILFGKNENFINQIIFSILNFNQKIQIFLLFLLTGTPAFGINLNLPKEYLKIFTLNLYQLINL